MVVPLVVTVSVEVAAAAPVIAAVAGDSAQVGVPVAPAGAVTAQVRATVPAKLFNEDVVIVEVPTSPGAGIVIAGPVRV